MNKRLLKWIATACSLTCIATAGFGIASLAGDDFQSAKAYEITLESGKELQPEYAYGALLSVPMGAINGEQTTKFVVMSPSGKVYKTENITLNESGQYTVVWYATVGGKEVSAEKSFLVTQSAFTVRGDVEWGYVESLEKVSAKDTDGDGVAETKTDGIKLSLSPESTFYYNKAIDLTDTSVPFAHIFPYFGIKNITETTDKTEYQYNEDARNYLITLTDAYDSTNSVTIDLEWGLNKDSYRTYYNFRAGAVGQTAHGLRSKLTDPKLQVTIDDQVYQYYSAPGQGHTSCNMIDDYGLQLYYDVESNQVKITYCVYKNGTYTVKEKALVADLDHEGIYPNNPFKGFTTGEVYLSISAKNYINPTANIDIAALGGVSGEDMLKVDMRDTKDPTIETVEALSKGSAFIALNEEITVPDAFVHDLSIPYGTKATAAVYYAYNPNSDKNVLVGLTNGKFTPNKQGTYTIVYSATDASGNVGTTTVDLQCVPGIDNKAVKLIVDSETTANAGYYVSIPECTVEGLYSDSTVKKYVQFEDEEKVLLESDQLFLKGVGNYVVTYVYETPFNSYTATCTIVSVASDKVVLGTSLLPEYFIKGAKYTLDTVYAYEYKAKEPTAVVAKTYMSADGGEYVEVDGKAVVINANENVRFKYACGGEETYSETVKVVDVGFGGALAMENYFHSEANSVTSSAASDGVRYVTDGTAENVTLKYINVLSLASFGIDFTILSKIGEEEYVAPTAVTFTLVDYYDRDNVVTLTMEGSGTSTIFYINGEQKATLSQAFTDKKLSVKYENGFTLGGKTYAWDGAFTSDRMLLWVTLEGMTGASCLNISKLNDNKLSNRENDNLEPTLYASKLNIGYQPINTVITIAQVSANDVLSPYLEAGLRLTARRPNGSYATSVDGILLDGTCPVDRAYELKLDEIGIYSVLYEYTDQNGNYCSLGYNPIIRDETSPVLTVKGVSENQVVEAAWGATVTVATYTVSDDISTEDMLDSWIYVFSPSGIAEEVANGGTFYAGEKGKYTVLYYCYDEAGNYTTFAYVVNVS